jgi:hypothetical protein
LPETRRRQAGDRRPGDRDHRRTSHHHPGGYRRHKTDGREPSRGGGAGGQKAKRGCGSPGQEPRVWGETQSRHAERTIVILVWQVIEWSENERMHH